MRAAGCRERPEDHFEYPVRMFLRFAIFGTLFASLISFSSSAPTQAAVVPRLESLGSISIPSIGVTAPLHVGIGKASLAKGFGLWRNTALPGSPGNTVIAGHRTSHTRPLFNIDKIVIGDFIYFYLPTGTAKYKVTKKQIVKPNDVWITRQTRASIATFFACHPLRSTALRYVVTASLVKFTEQKKS